MINIFETSFEARDRRFQIEKLYHGETVDLVGVVTTNGVPQNITGYSVSGVFQPTSMNGSPDFYELSADIVDNKVIVHWEKGKDFGENSYMVWALLTDGDNASYPIAWRLDMAYSPSYPLSDLAPIPKTIDFDKYELLNAPWLALSDVNDLQYLPLSGGTVDGNVYINGNLSSNSILLEVPTTQIGVGAEGNHGTAIGYNAKSTAFGTAVGSGADAGAGGGGGTAIGFGAEAKHAYSVAVGYLTKTETDASTAVGNSLTGNGHNSIVLGCYSKTSADNAIQLGGLYVVPSGYGDPYYQHQINNVPHSLKVMDKMVLSGDNLTLDPERVPYLSNYAKTADIPEVPTDLSAFTNSPGYLTAHQSLEDYYTKTQTDEKLTAYAQLSDLENIDVGEMSACLSSDEFTSVDFLSVDENKSIALSVVSLTDIGNKINQILVALKRMAIPDPPIDLTKTRVVYTDDSTAELDLTGNVLTSSIPNISNVKAISFGTNVTSLANDLFSGKTNLVSAEIPGTVAAVPQNCFNGCNNLASVTLHEGVTSIGNQAIRPYGAVADAGKSVLTALTLPNSLTSIGQQGLAFCCFPTITLPKNLSNLGSSVFTYNNKLTAINVDPENTTFSSEDGVLYQGTTCLVVPEAKTGAVTIKEGTTTLADVCAASAKCSSITLPSSLTTIGRYSCLGLNGSDPVGYTSLSIPSGVTSIGEYAFSGLQIPITMEGKTMSQVNSMSNKYWDAKSGASFICTDGTITR